MKVFITLFMVFSFSCAGTLFKVANDDIGEFEVTADGFDVGVSVKTNTTGLVCSVLDAGWMDWAKSVTDNLCPEGEV